MNYYNEFDPFAAAWLKNLVAGGRIPAGIVDSRPIQEVTPDDLIGFTQCHFFAGIGGWSLALAIAGWPENKPVWTGSCPCQPFSVAGKGRGTADERHLWPEFRRLIADCRLQSRLESRLRQRMDVSGSPEYALTWKHWDMESGPPICALRASARRTSDNGCGGWPTPDSQNFNDGADPVKHMERMEKLKEVHNNGNGAGLTLGIVSQMAGWPTPMSAPTTEASHGQSSGQYRRQMDSILAGWCIPMAQDGSRGGLSPRPQDTGVPLSQQAALAGWGTPRVTTNSGHGNPNRAADGKSRLEDQVQGATTGYPAPTGKRGVLNPELPRWLMGYPEGWGSYADTVTRFARK